MPSPLMPVPPDPTPPPSPTPPPGTRSPEEPGASASNNEDLLCLFVQHMPAAGAMLDRDFRYVMTSSRWVTDFGLDRRSLRGRSHFDVFLDGGGGWRGVFEQALRGTVQRGEEAPFLRRDGRTFWVSWEVRPWYRNDGEVGGLILFAEDKTDTRVVQEALQASRELLASIMASSLDGIMAFDAVRDDTGRIVDFEWVLANPRSRQLTGRPAEALIGKRLLEEMPGNRAEGLFDAYVRVVETGEPYERELRYRHDDIDAWFHLTATPLRNGFAVTFRDITERKEAEQELARANAVLEQRNRELQDFAYVASHDLQEPLRKIRAFADLLQEEYAGRLDETGRFYLERMGNAAERMATLISDLLAFSRVTTRGEPFRPVDLEDLVNDVLIDLEMAMAEEQGRVEVGDLPVIEADPVQMRQLFQNLIGNALKFHREDVPPVIRITARMEPAAGADEARCHIDVTDNGIGFDEKYLDRIFSPFQRLHGRGTYAGTGMGLAICRRIVERHHGTLTARSRPGEGSTFTVTLPCHQPTSPDPDRPTS